MASVMAVLIFVTVALVVFTFGAAALAPTSVLGSRLRALGWQRPQSQQKPAIRERLEQALDPLSKALPLSATEAPKTRAWLIQPGSRDARHLNHYCARRILLR